MELELEQSGLLWTGSEASFGLDPRPLELLELQFLTYMGVHYTYLGKNHAYLGKACWRRRRRLRNSPKITRSTRPFASYSRKNSRQRCPQLTVSLLHEGALLTVGALLLRTLIPTTLFSLQSLITRIPTLCQMNAKDCLAAVKSSFTTAVPGY